MIAKRCHLTGIWTVRHTTEAGNELIASSLELGEAINDLAALIASEAI